MRAFCLAAAIASAFALMASGQDIGREAKVDSVLASINGEPITLLDILLESGKEEARLSAMFTGERRYEETSKLRRRIVEEIVSRRLVYDSYKANPFPIERQYIEDMLDSLAGSMGDGTRKGLERRAKTLGTTLEELREKAKEKIAVDVMLMEFCDRQVSITPKDVFEHYQSHPEDWTKPARVELQLLLVGKKDSKDAAEACERIKSRLKDGDPFKLLVMELSEGPNAGAGGVMGAIDKDKLRPEFAQGLKEAKTGDVVGPVETPEGFYFIKMLSESAAETAPFEKAAPEIKRNLETSAKEAKRASYLEKLKDKAVVRYYF